MLATDEADLDEDEDEIPEVVNYEDIFEAAKLEHDENFNTPWDDDEGYAHEFTPYDKLDAYDRLDGKAWEAYKEGIVGWVRRCEREGGSGLITIDRDTLEGCFGEYNPFSGESRQVFEERFAEKRREMIEQVVEWYRDGWYAYEIRCEFLDEVAYVGGGILERPGYGVDDDAPYIVEMRHEAASEIVSLLEERGIKVVGGPPQSPPAEKFAWKRRCLAWHMGFKEYEEYRAWLAAGPDQPREPPPRRRR